MAAPAPTPGFRPTSPPRLQAAARAVVVAAYPWAPLATSQSVGSRCVARVPEECEHQPLLGNAALVWGPSAVRQLPRLVKQARRPHRAVRPAAGAALREPRAWSERSAWNERSAQCGRR